MTFYYPIFLNSKNEEKYFQLFLNSYVYGHCGKNISNYNGK